MNWEYFSAGVGVSIGVMIFYRVMKFITHDVFNLPFDE